MADGEAKRDWKLESAQDVCEAMDWLRRRMNGSGILLLAIGPNSVAVASDPKLRPEDAGAMLERELEAQVIQRAVEDMRRRKVTRSWMKRADS